MTPKGLAAIALTLIIAVPIILGYGLASEDSEITRTQDTDFVPITDALLNSESDYFITYSKTNNNADMIQRITAQGNTYYTYTSPDYVSVGDTYSSLPAYTTTPYDAVIRSPANTTNITVPSVPNSPGGLIIGDNNSFTSDWSKYAGRTIGTFANAVSYLITTSNTNSSYVYIDGITDTSYPCWDYTNAGGIESDSLYAVYGGDSWHYEVNGRTYSGDWAFICVEPSGTISRTEYEYTTVAPTVDDEAVDDWHLQMPDGGVVKVPNGSSYTYYGNVKSISHTTSYVFIDNVRIEYPTSIEISYPNGILSYYTKSYTQYANPAYGWYNATSSFPIYYNAWYNQYLNATVTFYVHFTGNGLTDFYEDFSAVSPLLHLKRVGGMITAYNDAGSATLGKYEFAQVIFDTREDTITVSGLTEFPAMGATPTTLSTVTLNCDFDGYIEQLKIVDQYTSIYSVTADEYATNGTSIQFSGPQPTPFYTFYLRDSSGTRVPSTQWNATMGSDHQTVTFTPISLSDGLYTFTLASPQVGSYSITIYIGTPGIVSTSPIAYRVDSAEIVAGDYPSTVDFTLDIWGLFPNDDVQKIYINSIGVYGKTISIAGRNYNVIDNAIQVTNTETGDPATVRLLKSTILMTLDNGTYTTTINGIPIASGTTAPTIYFGGEWSLTATRSTVTEETAIESKWVPGEFVLDTDGFVLVMLLTAVGAFVVLGMTGARSGAKVGLLALICGGAATIGLIIL